MAWTERQQAMLRAMGLRVWTPPVPDGAGGEDPAAAMADADHTADAEAEASRSRASAAPRSAWDGGSGAAAEPAGPGTSPDRRGARRHGGADAGPPPVAADRPATAAEADADAAARAARIATLDWPSLREAVAACTACGLCASRRQTVFGTGGTQAHWMVVGEAPGEQEDRQGEPFVGPAGRLLDQMLAALDLTRDPGEADVARQVYIANTLKCRPPGNRNPAPEEMARCEPFLRRQIALVRPRIILAMGRFAVQSLLRTNEAVGRLRGHVHAYEGVPLVVTYHPAYLLRNLPDKARAWQDLCLAAATAEAARARERTST